MLIDHDTLGTKDVKVHVTCTVKGDQLTVDLTGTDDRAELVGVWNTFANSRGYVMTQIAAAIDPTIVKNEGLFNAVEIIIPENTHRASAHQQAGGARLLPPRLRDYRSGVRRASQVVPERSAPQVYKIGMPNAVMGFKDGQMWMDQGVDARSMDVSAVQGIDGWGSCPVGLGNLLLSEAEDAESRFPIINLSREMTIDAGGAGQWRGQPGSLNVKKVLEPTMAMAWMVSAAHPLRGLCGGDDASPYSNRFEVGTPNEYKIELSAQAQLPAGAVIAYQHGGGAGFGSALLRDPEAVKEDVLDENVSIAARAGEIRCRLDRNAGRLRSRGGCGSHASAAAGTESGTSGEASQEAGDGGVRSRRMGYRVGIDIGGTFTDFAVLKGSDVLLHKNLSTPEDRSIGVMSGLEKLAQIENLRVSDFLGQCDAIVHATTIADNTLIEMNGALTGLITTEGFRDEMEYRRGFKEDIWDVRLPPPLADHSAPPAADRSGTDSGRWLCLQSAR